jgi:hypothetical protein
MSGERAPVRAGGAVSEETGLVGETVSPGEVWNAFDSDLPEYARKGICHPHIKICRQ